ncbi:hypothetical protein ACLOJK_026953, partial [Asimina triloba]
MVLHHLPKKLPWPPVASSMKPITPKSPADDTIWLTSIGSWSAWPTGSRLHLISMATRISMDNKVGQRSSPIHRVKASMENQAAIGQR